MSSEIFTKAFWKGAAERAVKTYAQTVVGLSIVGLGLDQTASGQELLAGAAGLTGSALASILLAGVAPTVLSLFMSIANPAFVSGSESEQEKAMAEIGQLAAELKSQSQVQGIAQLTAAALAERAVGLPETPAQDEIAARAEEEDEEPEPGTVPAV